MSQTIIGQTIISLLPSILLFGIITLIVVMIRRYSKK